MSVWKNKLIACCTVVIVLPAVRSSPCSAPAPTRANTRRHADARGESPSARPRQPGAPPNATHDPRSPDLRCEGYACPGAERVAGDSQCIVCILIKVMMLRGHTWGTLPHRQLGTRELRSGSSEDVCRCPHPASASAKYVVGRSAASRGGEKTAGRSGDKLGCHPKGGMGLAGQGFYFHVGKLGEVAGAVTEGPPRSLRRWSRARGRRFPSDGQRPGTGPQCATAAIDHRRSVSDLSRRRASGPRPQ